MLKGRGFPALSFKVQGHMETIMNGWDHHMRQVPAVKPLGLFLLLLFGVVLTACQTLSKEECVAADWQVIGEQDGAAGHAPQARFGEHVRSCEKAGIVPDQTLWNQGYQRGLVRFCTPLSGLSYGERGRTYHNVCPVELDGAFRSGYELGRKKHGKANEISSIRRRVSTKEADIRNLEALRSKGKIDENEAIRRSRDYRFDISDLSRELGRKEAELGQIEREIENFRLSGQFR